MILRCLTQNAGVLPFFIRVSKTKRNMGHLRTGSYIEFKAVSRSSSIRTITYSSVDAIAHQKDLMPHLTPIWLFTLEVINKTMPEGYHVPRFPLAIDRFYAHLTHQLISTNPLTPLLLVMHHLGLLDLQSTKLPESGATYSDLSQLGYSPHASLQADESALFRTHLQTLQNHFEISRFDALEIL